MSFSVAFCLPAVFEDEYGFTSGCCTKEARLLVLERLLLHWTIFLRDMKTMQDATLFDKESIVQHLRCGCVVLPVKPLCSFKPAKNILPYSQGAYWKMELTHNTFCSWSLSTILSHSYVGVFNLGRC